ncbi:pentatricopeptide repeat-containing protein At1g59720, chloroplastic/mitochondrial [Amborella trichopoda]|uniref:pentatricopeptide repeat-containing protein At1g59720, chloroplastic/mitochondrial n=1 Tax=Amborella trichopoda TaxID=13333 RepID=UPI0009BDC1A1|nr:pentatricopeptide repeat-containing protein At1g59720, chloroplastic/mitochondrial [Amborella trichopoda]|eukprot:XP_011625678.2 pentatricopeptide repeat-containing protein At1g59720, chloroplastic/mitochondrial [Amborella trichopoda]
MRACLCEPCAPPSHQDSRSWLAFLDRCTTLSLPHYKQVHALMLRSHALARSSLLDRAISTCAPLDPAYAARLLLNLPPPENPNSFAFNALIRAHAAAPCPHTKHQAIVLFRLMLLRSNPMPDKFSFPFVLKACAFLFALFEGKQIHGLVFKLGLAMDPYVNNGLVHMYASCGVANLARQLFDEMTEKNVVSWNSMIYGYVQLGFFEEALGLFSEMNRLGDVAPDAYTVHSVVCACAGLGAFALGVWAHRLATRLSLDNEQSLLMCNALIDMYAKCGCVTIARQVFDKMGSRDVSSWNTIIQGLSVNGSGHEALDMFSRMLKDGFKPNAITFVGLLSACAHSGLVNQGLSTFNSMRSRYGIEPAIEHYGCMVDLLGRNSRLDEAYELITTMPLTPDAIIWRTLLDSCTRSPGKLDLSKVAASHLLELDSDTSGAYVLLSKAYARANRWNNAGEVRKEMSLNNVAKPPGCSYLELDGVVHEFLAGDTSHSRSRDIYSMLDEVEGRLRSNGYVPDASKADVAEPDGGKEQSLLLHSDRVAIAFGLISTTPGTTIRLMKNLRVCSDCHHVIKLVSLIYEREVIMRDRARFHHFRQGSCSCMDYW